MFDTLHIVGMPASTHENKFDKFFAFFRQLIDKSGECSDLQSVILFRPKLPNGKNGLHLLMRSVSPANIVSECQMMSGQVSHDMT